MLKTKIDDICEIIVNLRSSAMTNQDYEQWYNNRNFIDEVSNELSLLSSDSKHNIKFLHIYTRRQTC